MQRHGACVPSGCQVMWSRSSFFPEKNPTSHVRHGRHAELKTSIGKVWKILLRSHDWKPCRPHLSPALTTAHQTSRLEACMFWLGQAEEWFERVLWPDEKWVVLTPAPSRKTTVYWCPSNLRNVVPCRKTRGEKRMAWVGIVDGKVFRCTGLKQGT